MASQTQTRIGGRRRAGPRQRATRGVPGVVPGKNYSCQPVPTAGWGQWACPMQRAGQRRTSRIAEPKAAQPGSTAWIQQQQRRGVPRVDAVRAAARLQVRMPPHNTGAHLPRDRHPRRGGPRRVRGGTAGLLQIRHHADDANTHPVRTQYSPVAARPRQPSPPHGLALLPLLRRRFLAASYTHQGQDVVALFAHYDRTNSGKISFEEFRSAARRDAKVAVTDVEDSELRALFDYVDTSSDGQIDIGEFARLLRQPQNRHGSALEGRGRSDDGSGGGGGSFSSTKRSDVTFWNHRVSSASSSASSSPSETQSPQSAPDPEIDLASMSTSDDLDTDDSVGDGDSSAVLSWSGYGTTVPCREPEPEPRPRVRTELHYPEHEASWHDSDSDSDREGEGGDGAERTERERFELLQGMHRDELGVARMAVEERNARQRAAEAERDEHAQRALAAAQAHQRVQQEAASVHGLLAAAQRELEEARRISLPLQSIDWGRSELRAS